MKLHLVDETTLVGYHRETELRNGLEPAGGVIDVELGQDITHWVVTLKAPSKTKFAERLLQRLGFRVEQVEV